MEGTEIDELEEVDTAVDLGFDEDARARLIGEIVAEWISSLGVDQAFTSGGVVVIGESVSGRRSPLPRGTGRNAAGNHLLDSGVGSTSSETERQFSNISASGRATALNVTAQLPPKVQSKKETIPSMVSL